MTRIRMPKLLPLFRLIDWAMVPIMFVLGGFKKDSVQETHPWHCFRGFSPDDIDQSLAVPHQGTDNSTFKRHFLFLFHAPILGGWKNYVVLQPKQPTTPFYIGWVTYHKDTKAPLDIGINKLPIVDRAVRLLSGPPHYAGYFFAIDDKGRQIALEKVATGRLGDNAHPGLRLL